MTAYVATFYSFKGGVGRTTLLVNVAHVLADRGKRVLIWDLDLEAPGIHQFPGLEPPEKLWQSGFLEWLGDTPACPSLEPDPAWPSQTWLNTLGRCVYATHGTILVLPALGTLANLGRVYGAVDWHRLFVEHPEHGLHLLCRVRDALIAQFEPTFVLIDSRTGISDLGGFVTGFVPDCTVLVGNYSAQSTQGLRSVYLALDRFATERVQSEPHRHRKLDRLLVASPVPTSPDEQASARTRWSKGFPGVAPRAMVEVPLVENLLYAEDVLVRSAPSSDAARAYATVAARLIELRASYVRAVVPDNQREHEAAQLANVAQLLQRLGLDVVKFHGRGLIVRERTPFSDSLHQVGYLQGMVAPTPKTLDMLTQLRAQSGTTYDRPLLIVDAAFQDTRRAAEEAGVMLRTTGELMEQIVDLRAYAATVRRAFEDSELARSYVTPQLMTAAGMEDALVYARRWATGHGPQLSVIDGDAGSGRTSLLRRLAYDLALQLDADPATPVPVLIDLHNVDPHATLASMLQGHLGATLGWYGNPDAILHLWDIGRIILLCDGLDELPGGDPELLRLRWLASSTDAPGLTTTGRRMMVTTNLHAMPPVRPSGRPISSHLNVEVATIAPFDPSRITTFLGFRLGDAAEVATGRILGSPTLAQLASVPMRLRLLAEIMSDRDDACQDIATEASLYDHYVTRWVSRPAQDSALQPVQRARVLEHLAAELWRRRHPRIPLQLLIETLRDRVAMELTTSTLDLELRGAPFVSRTLSVEYGFTHECFLLYFLACHLVHGLRTSVDALRDALATEPITPACAALFVALVVDCAGVHDSIHAIAHGDYTAQASENALRLIAALRPAQETSQPQPGA